MIYARANSHTCYTYAIEEANMIHIVCKIAPVLITNVNHGELGFQYLVHMDIELFLLIFAQIETLNLTKCSLDLGNH